MANKLALPPSKKYTWFLKFYFFRADVFFYYSFCLIFSLDMNSVANSLGFFLCFFTGRMSVSVIVTNLA